MKLTVEEKRDLFIAAIQCEVFGKCPNPSGGSNGMRLHSCIENYVYAADGKVKVVRLHDWNKAEKRYALTVAEKLGFTPRW